MIVFAVMYGVSTVLGLIGNLFVLLVVALYSDFHNMRYFLLASLALSDFLMAIMVGHRAVANGVEEWIFGATWCQGTAFLLRVVYLNTVTHLCAVSYDRYNAIVKRPLTYNCCVTKKRFFLNVIILWVLPAIASTGPFIGWGAFVYNPEIFACEQKWDGQTAIPFSIASFAVPLGAMIYLNYKVLKVVLRLQRGVETINKSLSSPENKSPDYPDHRQQCPRDEQCDDGVQQNPKQQEELPGIKNGGHSPQMSHRGSKVENRENAAYQAEPGDFIGTMHQEKVVCGERSRRTVRSTHCRSISQTVQTDNRPSEKTTKDGANDLSKKSGKKSCQKKKRHFPDQANTLEKANIQVHLTVDKQSSHSSQNGTLEDTNGLKFQKAKERSCSFQKPSFDRITIENGNGMEDASTSQSQSGRRSREDILKRQRNQKCETHREKTQAPSVVAQACRANSSKEACFRSSSSSQELSRFNNADDLRRAELIESLPQGDSLQPNQSPTQKQQRPPGKTQMRLTKLLKEGKAARDVMIIIGAFVVCYLPLWIMAMLRAAGDSFSAEAILSVHLAYSLSMVCNPIIYSIRKREFRKGLRKLLKL